MKKLIVLFAFLACFAAANATDFNAPVLSGNVTMSSQVIVPFTAIPYPGAVTTFPTVIKGQNRTWTELPVAQRPHLFIFKLGKAADHSVGINVYFDPNPVTGVQLNAHWHWWDTDPAENYEGTWDITTTSFNWYGPQWDGWVGLILDGLDASAATTTGDRIFTCHISGSYTDL